MAGRKPDYRLMFVEESKGRKVWFKLGSGWKNADSQSIGIEVNVGLPITLGPRTKLVLVENTVEGEESDTAFNSATM